MRSAAVALEDRADDDRADGHGSGRDGDGEEHGDEDRADDQDQGSPPAARVSTLPGVSWTVGRVEVGATGTGAGA